MRKTLLLLFAAVLAVGISSCQKAVLDDSDQSDTKKRTVRNVSLLMDEEFVTISETLMTRSVTEGKVYAVNVYEKKAGAKSYAKYAYGLFTDPSQMNIMLTEGNLYRFECLIVTTTRMPCIIRMANTLHLFCTGAPMRQQRLRTSLSSQRQPISHTSRRAIRTSLIRKSSCTQGFTNTMEW